MIVSVCFVQIFRDSNVAPEIYSIVCYGISAKVFRDVFFPDALPGVPLEKFENVLHTIPDRVSYLTLPVRPVPSAVSKVFNYVVFTSFEAFIPYLFIVRTVKTNIFPVLLKGLTGSLCLREIVENPSV